MNRIPIGHLIDRAAFCDPAGGQTRLKRQRARSAIVVVGQDDIQRIFVLHAWADRVTTDKLYERIFEVNQDFAPNTFGVEANGLQSLFGDGVRREARLTGQRIPLVPVVQPTKLEKTFRNRSALQPLIAEGRLFLQPHQHELKEELATHPMSSTFDLVDALSSAISLLPKRAIIQTEDTEVENLARYLRRTGAPPWLIERHVEEFRRRVSQTNHRLKEASPV